MKKPVITITTNFTSQEIEKKPESAYAAALIGAGATPVLLPRDIPQKDYPSLCEKYDGILLSGGGDVDIRLFAGEPNPAIGNPSPQRDRLEIALVHLALENGLPLFGICRGIQVLNIALGGTLYTDIPSQYQTSLQHSTPAEKGRQNLAHAVDINPDSLIHRFTSATHLDVNSFHHQAIRQPAPGLVITARATDGLIEAVEIPGSKNVTFGVQWHPENLQSIPVHKALFTEFVNSCR